MRFYYQVIDLVLNFLKKKASMRQKGAGLGSTTYEMDPNDTYKDAARKAARARYEKLS